MGEPTICEYWIGEGGRCQLKYKFLGNRTKIEINNQYLGWIYVQNKEDYSPSQPQIFFFSNMFLNAFIVYLFQKNYIIKMKMNY